MTEAAAAFERLARVFNKVFGDEHVHFELAEPASLTAKDRHGKYSARAFIGGEKFVPSSAYVGKRGHLIFVFKPATPAADFAHVEMDEDKAIRLLAEFRGYINAILSRVYDRHGESVQETVRAHEEERRIRENTALLANPDYASW